MALSGQLALTEWRPLSDSAIPDSPQAAGPAVPERDIAAGGVPGCSGMPGTWKWQPARQSSRNPGGQDTVEGHGGFDVVTEKFVQWEQENPASDGREMIDDFRLRGSPSWRRMGDTATKGGWRTQVAHQVAHAFDHRNPSHSEGEALAVVVQAVPGNPHWTRVDTDCLSPPGYSPVRRRHCVSAASHGASWRRTGGGGSGESDPHGFSALVRHRAGEMGAQPKSSPSPLPFSGVAPSTVIPGGKAIEHLFALTVDACVSV